MRTARFISKTKSTSREVLFVLEASPRLELGVRILQTLALPLGYDAISCIGDADTLCGAGDGVAICDGDLAVRTRAGLRILRSSLREAESRLYDLHRSFGFRLRFYLCAIVWSGRRDSDPRLSPWQGDTLPLSHSRTRLP